MTFLERLAEVVGPAQVLTGADCAPYSRDWMGWLTWTPLAVVRPGSTAEVAAVVRLASAEGVPVVPFGGRTGLTGATAAEGQLVLSVERLNRIREVRAPARVAVAEAGVIVERLQDAAEREGLYFPLLFGARGSAMIGGALSTNAGGSNVLRYGSMRAQCLGLEVVLADGRVLNLMSELYKDNSGYDLKQLFIGAEGTLGIITAAVLRLVPMALAHATAMLAVPSLDVALGLLNRLQAETGGRVEAFEFMPRSFQEYLVRARPDLGLPFGQIHETTILVELGSSAPHDSTPGPDGEVPLQAALVDALGRLADEGLLVDAVVASSEAQRRQIWARREASAEIVAGTGPWHDADVSVPLDKVAVFLDRAVAQLADLDPGGRTLTVAHLGDGNLHYSVLMSRHDPALEERITEGIEDIVADLGGSFSAEHGIGLYKKSSMKRRKDPVALEVMRAIKRTLDPGNILNPGKVLPD